MHEQTEGRVCRDGQKDPVTAYYLLSDSGSDPVVSEVLGFKKGQIQGIRDPNADVTEKVADTKNRVKILAENYLRQKNLMKDDPNEEKT